MAHAQGMFRKFIPFRKIDEAKREVYGLVTSEAIDGDGEICDYPTSKPYYQEWSEAISKASGGKSLGNIRAMHRNVAAGKVTRLEFLDDDKEIWVVGKIVDDEQWKLCAEGVYTGFSHGGLYVDTSDTPGSKLKADARGHMRYTVDPVEVSIVDSPCNPEATFEYVKANGSVELRKFKKGTSMTDKAKREVKKNMYDVAALARLLCDIKYLQMNAAYEAEYEEDESAQPERLQQWLADGVAILVEMVDEEGAEMLAGKVAGKIKGGTMEKTESGDLAKATSVAGHYKVKAKFHAKMAKLHAHQPDAADEHEKMAAHYGKMAEACSQKDDVAQPAITKTEAAAPAENKETPAAAAASPAEPQDLDKFAEKFQERLLVKVGELVESKLGSFLDALIGEESTPATPAVPAAEAAKVAEPAKGAEPAKAAEPAKVTEIDKGKAAVNEAGNVAVPKEADNGGKEKTNEPALKGASGRDVSKLREILRTKGTVDMTSGGPIPY